MKKSLVWVVLFTVIGGAAPAYAQGAQSQTGDQLDTCRQNVIQLTEQSRLEQAKLAKLRTDRKTLGASGGEVVRYKLANLDQEIREHSKQNQSLSAQVETESKRCDAIAARASGNRGAPAQPSGRKP